MLNNIDLLNLSESDTLPTLTRCIYRESLDNGRTISAELLTKEGLAALHEVRERHGLKPPEKMVVVTEEALPSREQSILRYTEGDVPRITIDVPTSYAELGKALLEIKRQNNSQVSPEYYYVYVLINHRTGPAYFSGYIHCKLL